MENRPCPARLTHSRTYSCGRGVSRASGAGTRMVTLGSVRLCCQAQVDRLDVDGFVVVRSDCRLVHHDPVLLDQGIELLVELIVGGSAVDVSSAGVAQTEGYSARCGAAVETRTIGRPEVSYLRVVVDEVSDQALHLRSDRRVSDTHDQQVRYEGVSAESGRVVVTRRLHDLVVGRGGVTADPQHHSDTGQKRGLQGATDVSEHLVVLLHPVGYGGE
jgi:hypothetical protein